MSLDRRLFLFAAAAALTGCAGDNAGRMPLPGGRGQDAGGNVQRVSPADFPNIPFADWTDTEPEYVLYPGDEIEVATPTAPELTRTLKVGPDGRIALPLIGQIMAADRTLAEVEQVASQAYAAELVRPVVEITLKLAGPLKVWVAGEVRTPGVFDMAGDIDAYQAIVMAGDFLPSAKPQEVALIRRGPGGRRMMRVVDLRPRRGEVVALRRGDILYVPRSNLGELANFFTQVRNALPVGFSYSINGQYQQF
ncbi:MAG: polysaccharide export protein [bacterium]|jgi:polysaccharide export outer membrane protein|nr:MAG: polysaccharide export protein [bacterium]